MRKQIVIIMFCLFSAASAFAQDEGMPRFEFSVSGGQGLNNHLSLEGRRTKFSFVTEFKYTPIKWVSLGLMFSCHDEYYMPNVISDITEPVQKLGTNIMLSVYSNWYTNDWLRVYSGVFYGTTCLDYKNELKYLREHNLIDSNVQDMIGPGHSYQIVPVGASIGRRLYGFAEFGNGRMFRNFRAGIGYRF